MAASATRKAVKRTATAGAAKKRPGKSVASRAVAAPVKHSAGRGLVKQAAAKGMAVAGRRVLSASGQTVRAAANRSAEVGRSVLEAGVAKRAPIQVSVDVAVPLKVAWDEWMTFSAFTEGVNHLEAVERDGACLVGRTAGPRSVDWLADIVDERDQESFAWRSVEGSDCAGLVTFHRLSERLTRIELDLDVLPTSPAEAISLTLRVADRRAETELRRFKAEVEFINPDVYAHLIADNGDRPKQRGKRQRDE